MTRVWGIALLVLLLALPAHADGISGGLAGMRSLAYVALVVFVVGWIFVWVVLRLIGARPGSSEGRRYWLANPEIPIGLRGLALMQYVLAFLYAMGAFFRCIFPAHFQNGRFADWVIHSILFGVLFSVLAVLSANGYVRRSAQRGFKLGSALGWICIGNAFVYLVWHGRYYGFDPVSPFFGSIVLVLLNWRYRPYFGREQRSELFLKLKKLGRWTALVAGSFLFLVMSSSLLVTSVFPADEEKAFAMLGGVAEAIAAHRQQQGQWPESVDQLDSSVDLRYRWRKVAYSPEDKKLTLDVKLAYEPDLLYRLSFGLLGYAEETVQIGKRLR